MSIPRRDAGPTAAQVFACHANARPKASRLALAAALLCGMAACSSAPQYPIYAGERPGDGSIIATQPAYPISAKDAAQNAADRASQNGYPAYGAPPAGSAQNSPYAPPSRATPPPPADDQTDDAPRSLQSAPVDSSDLPPPSAAPAPSDPPPPPPPPPYEGRAIARGGAQLVFGTDSIERPRLVFAVEDGAPPPLDLIAYRHRHHTAAADAASGDDTAKPSDTKTSAHSRRHPGVAAKIEAAPDTSYQTVVKPGEKLSDVAERVHSSREALAQLNDVKHPRHVRTGTVLKVPYRYTYEVQKGDTLYTISHRFNQDPAAMAKLNGLKTVPTLQPGETIQLPPTAEDAGKRDHATAPGPSPVAAPDKLADAELRKESRHGRHRHADEAEANTAAAPTAAPTVEPGPAHLSRAERRRLRREGKAVPAVAASTPAEPSPATPQTAEAAPVHLTRAERRRLRREGKPIPPEVADAPAQTPPAATQTAEAEPAHLTRAERRRLRREGKPASAQVADAPAQTPPATPQTTEAEPAHLTRAERRRLRREEKASRMASASPIAAPAEAASVRAQSPRPPSVAQASPYPSGSPSASEAYAPAVSALVVPSPYPSAATATASPRTYPPTVASASVAAAGSTAPQPYYAGTRPYTSPVATPSTSSTAPYRATAGSSVSASTYAMPGYTPRASTTATGSSHVASLTAPTYAPGYATGGYSPSLGRARPVTPTVSGIAGLTPSQVTAAGRGRFIWPLRGAVISGFGDKGTGQHNDGVDIAAVPGSGVRAAAAGEIVYAGSSIPGFGNLVLVKHSGGWVTAYAHLDRIEVRMRDSVAQGDELGQAGQTGAVDRPQLHFEVRYAPDPTEKARPVDPTLVLPAG